LEILDQVRNKKNLDKFKKKELKRIKVNSKFKQSHVDKILYGISQGLNVKIYAPISEFKDKMRIWGMLSDGRNPKASGVIFRYHDIFIIEYYKQKALGFLSYYKPAMNFHGVKKLVDYHLRWSLLHTLAGKHNLKIHQVIKNYGKTPEILLEEKSGKNRVLAKFLTPNEINYRSRGFITSFDPIKFKNNLDKFLVKLSLPKVLFIKKCAAINCVNTGIDVYNIPIFLQFKHGYIVESIKTKKK